MWHALVRKYFFVLLARGSFLRRTLDPLLKTRRNSGHCVESVQSLAPSDNLLSPLNVLEHY